ILAITTTSERTGRWTRMHRPFVPFSVPESSTHTRSSADCITITFGFRFSVHTTYYAPGFRGLRRFARYQFRCDWLDRRGGAAPTGHHALCARDTGGLSTGLCIRHPHLHLSE